jgi:hypothetical protein
MADTENLELRLAMLERGHEALRAFIEPAFWNLVDRVYAQGPPPDTARCLACDLEQRAESFGRRHDQCVFGGGVLERLECPRCGCVFGPLKYLDLTSELVSLDYRLLYTHHREGDSTEHEVRAFQALTPAGDGAYLNWGAGAWSSSIARLRERGWNVWGYEPNLPTDDPFVVSDWRELDTTFDGIFSNNLIEHLPDPAAQFVELRRLLKPGGRMAHASPCFEWSYGFSRFHVFFPLADAPRVLANRTGFDLVDRLDDGDFRVRVFEARE